MKILLDMDGVLADFVTAALAFHGVDNFYDDHQFRGPGGWGAIVEQCSDSPEQFWGNLDLDFWANLPKTREADKLVEMAEMIAGSESVALLSSPSWHVDCMRGKLEWIRQHYPQFSRRFLFGPAKAFCAARDTVLIDDYDQNVASFEAAGGHALLMPRPWNSLEAMDGDTANIYLQLSRLKRIL